MAAAPLYTAGNVVLGAAGVEGRVGGGVSDLLPATGPLNAGVTGVLTGTGQALQQPGHTLAAGGTAGLVGGDGALAQAQVLNTSVGGAAQGAPLVGLGVLSPTQPTGQVATVGLGSNGQTATLAVPAVSGTGTGGAILSSTGAGLSNTVDSVLGGATGASGIGVLAPVTSVVGGLTAGLN